MPLSCYSYSLSSYFFPTRYLLTVMPSTEAVSFNLKVMTSSWWLWWRSLWRSCAVEPAQSFLSDRPDRDAPPPLIEWGRRWPSAIFFTETALKKKEGVLGRGFYGRALFFCPTPPRSRWPDGYCGDKSNFRGEDKAARRLEGRSDCSQRSSPRAVTKEIHTGADVSYLGIFFQQSSLEITTTTTRCSIERG